MIFMNVFMNIQSKRRNISLSGFFLGTRFFAKFESLWIGNAVFCKLAIGVQNLELFSHHFFQITSRPMATWKTYARIILAHVSLIVLSVVYVGFGAFLFYQLEQPNEVEVRARNIERFNIHKRQMIEHLWEMRESGIGQRKFFRLEF